MPSRWLMNRAPNASLTGFTEAPVAELHLGESAASSSSLGGSEENKIQRFLRTNVTTKGTQNSSIEA